MEARHTATRGDKAPDLVFCMTKHFWGEGVTANNVKNRASSVDIISQAFHYELCKAVEFCFTICVWLFHVIEPNGLNLGVLV